MAIDFFRADCCTQINAEKFGLCDDPPPPHAPAYTDTATPEKWIATVLNEEERTVRFVAVDHCTVIRRTDDPIKMESLCDAILTYDDRIVFVELKDAKYRGVFGEAENQLENTIRLFRQHHNLLAYKKGGRLFLTKPNQIFLINLRMR